MKNEYPEYFKPQTMGLERFAKLAEKGQKEVLSYFQSNPLECELVIRMSYDKRYSPSTYVQEVEKKYHVGWFNGEDTEVKIHKELAAAIADFVLFSFGKPRLSSEKDKEVPTTA
jgi:hypothetical protein